MGGGAQIAIDEHDLFLVPGVRLLVATIAAFLWPRCAPGDRERGLPAESESSWKVGGRGRYFSWRVGITRTVAVFEYGLQLMPVSIDLALVQQIDWVQ